MISFVGCKRHNNSENETEIRNLSAKIEFQSSGRLDRREFRGLGTDHMSSLRDEEIEFDRPRRDDTPKEVHVREPYWDRNEGYYERQGRG